MTPREIKFSQYKNGRFKPSLTSNAYIKFSIEFYNQNIMVSKKTYQIVKPLKFYVKNIRKQNFI